MYTVFDIANYFLSKESMSHKKLQKLVYYAYSWILALLNESGNDLQFHLFNNRIEAWVHGPVIPDLYQEYKKYGWQDIPKKEVYNGPAFSTDVEDVLTQVWDVYGNLKANELEMLSHRETPWINARKGVAAYESTSNEILDSDIFNFFNEQANL